MSNYQQTTVSGESWVRAKRIVIENPLGEISEVKFVEEKIVNADSTVFKKDLGVLNVESTDDNMSQEIPILDPSTGETTTQVVTYAEVYNILKSAYLHFAGLRDNPPVEEPVEDIGAIEQPEGGGV